MQKRRKKEKKFRFQVKPLLIYVPRMFSLLPIGEAKLDDSGTASVEFPASLPGDKEGNITIIARFEEHPEFGNVEKKSTLEWGSPWTHYCSCRTSCPLDQNSTKVDDLYSFDPFSRVYGDIIFLPL